LRIEPNRTSPELGTEQAGQPATKNVDQQSAGPSAVDDTTSLSDTVNVKSLLAQALATPELRQDRIEGLRQAITSGQYQIDANSIAAAMVG
jgi:flagellar biosynthesis anti-sigma factor FlgM